MTARFRVLPLFFALMLGYGCVSTGSQEITEPGRIVRIEADKSTKAEISALLQARKSDPGPAEIAIPGFGVFRAKAAYRIDGTLSVYAVVSNLTDRFYLARPDPDAMEEPGRSLSLGLSLSF